MYVEQHIKIKSIYLMFSKTKTGNQFFLSIQVRSFWSLAFSHVNGIPFFQSICNEFKLSNTKLVNSYFPMKCVLLQKQYIIRNILFENRSYFLIHMTNVRFCFTHSKNKV